MKKSELKNLIKECVKEVLAENDTPLDKKALKSIGKKIEGELNTVFEKIQKKYKVHMYQGEDTIAISAYAAGDFPDGHDIYKDDVELYFKSL